MACTYICLIAYEVELMKLILLPSYEKRLFTSGLHLNKRFVCLEGLFLQAGKW